MEKERPSDQKEAPESWGNESSQSSIFKIVVFIFLVLVIIVLVFFAWYGIKDWNVSKVEDINSSPDIEENNSEPPPINETPAPLPVIEEEEEEIVEPEVKESSSEICERLCSPRSLVSYEDYEEYHFIECYCGSDKRIYVHSITQELMTENEIFMRSGRWVNDGKK